MDTVANKTIPSLCQCDTCALLGKIIVNLRFAIYTMIMINIQLTKKYTKYVYILCMYIHKVCIYTNYVFVLCLYN